jgi:uncharacterized repeat protein (TIGR01451 family)
VDAGGFSNTATANAAFGGSVTSHSNTATVTATAAPGLTITKSASPNDAAHFKDGQVITYSFVVTNTGNVTLTNVAPAESSFTGIGTLSTITCPAAAASVAPDSQVTCTATYTITQADVDKRQITNEATATGTPPSGPPTDSSSSHVTIPADQHPALAMVKHATVNPAADQNAVQVGDVISYTFDVTDTGNVTVTNLSVSDPTLGSVTCPQTTLIPNQKVTCAGDHTHTVTDVDVAAGKISNIATALADPPGGGSAISSMASTATVDAAAPGPSTPPLASTGANIALPSGIGAAMLLLGLLLVCGSRRKHNW